MAKFHWEPSIAGNNALLLSRVIEEDHISSEGGKEELQNGGAGGSGTRGFFGVNTEMPFRCENQSKVSKAEKDYVSVVRECKSLGGGALIKPSKDMEALRWYPHHWTYSIRY